MNELFFDLLRGIVLGAVQGLAEFFPVSSSGHLILVPILFGWPDQGLAFDTVLHLGTLGALLWFFREDLIVLFRAAVGTGKEADEARGFGLKILAATVPAALIALLANDWIEANLRSGFFVALNLVVWGIVLFAADRASEKGSRLENLTKISWKQALAIGFAQPLALFPGTSRSGITISAGLFSGLSRTAAARFSFLLSIPITALAGLHGAYEIASTGLPDGGFVLLIAGFLSALLFGLFAIRFLLSFVAKRRYDGFVVYRFILACAVTILT
ncbi:undecaprenyl-diphosphatase UppP [Candidatus Uhrbacteria bacterium]|nr:undecaprenyl-diphosphatase UppP [Candidatus Uhrbacteria bacterium]